ncbi:hypothetical protein [Synechococcus sp. CC9311]|uniref:hypothetical protein n=1 Tax=Synechococcus sp. (strain CC9311) TaxID=64471 RepID=UPI0011D16E7A|nr:hypothetical protein [Synechococcus sp. CC9311]
MKKPMALGIDSSRMGSDQIVRDSDPSNEAFDDGSDVDGVVWPEWLRSAYSINSVQINTFLNLIDSQPVMAGDQLSLAHEGG